MGTPRRRWSPDEKAAILTLSKEGWTYKEIADKLRPGVKTAWRSVGEIFRESCNPTAQSVSAITPVIPSSKSPRSNIELPDAMADSLTAKAFMELMDDDQKAIFIATYEDLRGDADEESLTSAENDMLIRTAYSNVKYLRAQYMLHIAESYLMMELEGQLSDTDADNAKKRLAGGRESYKKEVEQWSKEYMDLLNDLKLTRKQRLDKIKDTRNTFLDLQQDLVNKTKQDSLISEIKKINLATEDEFRRLARGEADDNGNRVSWLIGAFTEFVSLEDTSMELNAPQLEDDKEDKNKGEY